eukprot:g23211.t1
MGICASHVLDPSVFDLIPPDSRREALSAAVERDRTALVLADGRVLLWHEGRMPGRRAEVTLLFPEPPSVLWCDGQLLCFGGRHMREASLLVKTDALKMNAGNAFTLNALDLGESAGEVKSPDGQPIVCAASSVGVFATSTDSLLCLWAANWPPPCEPSMRTRTRTPQKVIQMSFVHCAEEVLLVLYSDVLHLHDSSLQLQHIWRWTEPGASVTLPEPSVPSARATVLLSQETSSGTRVGWLDLCDKGQPQLADLPSLIDQVSLSGSSSGRLRALVQRRAGRCCLLSSEPVLTRSMAMCLRQSYLKAWERSMTQLARSCSKLLPRPRGKAKPEVQQLLQRLSMEVQQLHQPDPGALLEAAAGGTSHNEAQNLLSRVLPKAVEKLGQRLDSEEFDSRRDPRSQRSPQDGQLFHERFLADFPVQGDPKLDEELHSELEGVAQQWLELVRRQLTAELEHLIGQGALSIGPYFEILAVALDDAVLQAAAAITDCSAAREAASRLHGAGISSLAEELCGARRPGVLPGRDSLAQDAEEVELPGSLESLSLGDLPLRQVRLPERLKSLALGREKTELLHLPASLESLTLGENYNQLFEVELPKHLQSLTFGDAFNKSLENVSFPPSLLRLTFGRSFEKRLDHVTLPENLLALTLGRNFNHVQSFLR